MNLKDRIALIKAGYTKEDIKGFTEAEEKETNENENPSLLEQLETLKNEITSLKDARKEEQTNNIESDTAEHKKVSDGDFMNQLTNFIMGDEK